LAGGWRAFGAEGSECRRSSVVSVLPRVEWSVSPELASFAGYSLRWFTLLWWCELLLGFWLLSRQIRRGGGDDSEAADLAVYVWVGLIVGARLGEAFFYNWQQLATDPTWVFRIASGGISSHGAIIGAGLAVYLYARRRALPFVEVTDRLAPSFAIAAIVHRLANLFNSEIVGKPTDGSWGVRFPFYDGVMDGPFRHPSQLYEATLGVLLAGCLWAADRHWRREQRPRGIVTGIALSVYFAGRCLVELMKEPQPSEIFTGPLNMGQLLSLPLLAAGLFLSWRSLRVRAVAGWCAVAPR
jgi:phosphatidylglycerol---prolipoprotein diacylglyceryl transferase